MKNTSIKKNYIYNLLYNLFSLILPLVTVPYVSKVLEPDGIGIQSYTTSITTYFIMFGSLGIASYGRREISMVRDKKNECNTIFWELVIVRCVTTGIALIGYFFVIAKSANYSIYLIANTVLIVASIFDFTWFFQGIENFKLVVTRNIIIRIIGTACLFFFIHKKSDLFLYILILAITTFGGNLSVIFKLCNHVEKVPLCKLNPIRHLREVLIYFIPTVASSVYNVLDKLMLGLLTGSEFENGYYEQSERIINIANNILFSLNVVVGARISYLHAQEKIDEIKRRLTEVIQIIIMLSIPMALGIIAISSNLVQWFLGSSFQKSAELLKILAPLSIIVGINNCIGVQCLIPLGKRKQVNIALCAGALLNLVCNMFMITRWQSVGAAIATIMAETLITILYLIYAREYYSIRYIVRISIKYIVSGIVMLLVIIALEVRLVPSIWSTVAEIIIGAAVYGVALILLRDKFTIEKAKEFLKINGIKK